MDQQRAKEVACLYAVRRGMALFSRGHQVWGVYANGRTVLVCGSRQVSDLWVKAAGVLIRDEEYLKSTTPSFRLSSSKGMYTATSFWKLLWVWMFGPPTELYEPPGDVR